MIMRKASISLIISFLVFSVLPINMGITAEPATVLKFSPNPTLNVTEGAEFSVDIIIEKAVDLYGYQMNIGFDHDVLEAQEVIKPDNFDFSNAGVIDNTEGRISEIFATKLGNVGGINGSARLATVNFRAKTSAETELIISNTKLSDSNSREIEHLVETGTVNPHPPIVTIDSISPDPTNASGSVTIHMRADDTVTGNHNIYAAEYFLDSLGDRGTGVRLTPNDGAYDEAVEEFTVELPIGSLAAGTHTIYFHASDVIGRCHVCSVVATRTFTISQACVASLRSLSPLEGEQSKTLDVELEGVCTNFIQGQTSIDFGSGITVKSVIVESTVKVKANIKIDPSAVAGTRDVMVTTGSEIVSKHDAFKVVVAEQASDTNAPRTSIQLTPSNPDGANGWYIIAPKIELSATDNAGGEGVDKTIYQWDSGQEHIYNTPLTAPEGAHILMFYSKDNAKNIEAAQKIAIKVDLTDPQKPLIDYPAAGSELCPDSGFIKGKAGNGDELALIDMILGESIRTTTAVSGMFEFSNSFTSGTHKIAVRATDQSGRTTVSDSVAFSVTCQLPSLMVDPPLQDPTHDPLYEVMGKTDGVSVSINGKSAEIINGEFRKQITLKEGENKIIVIAENAAHRQNKKELSVTLIIVPPEVPADASSGSGSSIDVDEIDQVSDIFGPPSVLVPPEANPLPPSADMSPPKMLLVY